MLAALGLVFSAAGARADELRTPLRRQDDETRRIVKSWSVVTALPSARPVGTSMDLSDIPFVHRVYDEFAHRRVRLGSDVIFTMVSGTRLMTLEVLKHTRLSVTPVGLNSGTLALEMRF